MYTKTNILRNSSKLRKRWQMLYLALQDETLHISISWQLVGAACTWARYIIKLYCGWYQIGVGGEEWWGGVMEWWRVERWFNATSNPYRHKHSPCCRYKMFHGWPRGEKYYHSLQDPAKTSTTTPLHIIVVKPETIICSRWALRYYSNFIHWYISPRYTLYDNF